MFIAVLFTIVKIQMQPKCPSVDEWIKCCGTITQWNSTRRCHKREETLTLCDVSCSSRQACNAVNFPHRTALAMSHRFWFAVFSYSFVSWYLLISYLISLLTQSFFQYHVIQPPWFCVFLRFFFVAIGFYFHTIWSEKMLDMISVFLNLLRLVLCPNIGLQQGWRTGV